MDYFFLRLCASADHILPFSLPENGENKRAAQRAAIFKFAATFALFFRICRRKSPTAPVIFCPGGQAMQSDVRRRTVPPSRERDWQRRS